MTKIFANMKLQSPCNPTCLGNVLHSATCRFKVNREEKGTFQHKAEAPSSKNWTHTLVLCFCERCIPFWDKDTEASYCSGNSELSDEAEKKKKKKLLTPLILLHRNSPDFLNIKTIPFNHIIPFSAIFFLDFVTICKNLLFKFLTLPSLPYISADQTTKIYHSSKKCWTL